MNTPYDSDWSDRPTLQAARREAHLTSREVAEAAGVPLKIEYQMEIGGIVSQEDAEKILAAFSRLSGEACSLDTVQVALSHHAACLADQPPRVLPSTRVCSSLGKEYLLS
jgi:hypothetical protein